MQYTADFETTTDENDCRVWGWAVCDINNPDHTEIGDTIDDFMEYCRYMVNSSMYFHNLKFDGMFILNWLFLNNFRHVADRSMIEDKTFTTLISDKGMFYSIKVIFQKFKKEEISVTFYDSLKILPFPVKDIANGFNLPISKLEIDYHKHRPLGYVLTKEERDYIRNDVEIMARALKILFDENMTKMTQGSNALANYKARYNKKQFDTFFPCSSL